MSYLYDDTSPEDLEQQAYFALNGALNTLDIVQVQTILDLYPNLVNTKRSYSQSALEILTMGTFYFEQEKIIKRNDCLKLLMKYRDPKLSLQPFSLKSATDRGDVSLIETFLKSEFGQQAIQKEHLDYCLKEAFNAVYLPHRSYSFSTPFPYQVLTTLFLEAGMSEQKALVREAVGQLFWTNGEDNPVRDRLQLEEAGLMLMEHLDMTHQEMSPEHFEKLLRSGLGRTTQKTMWKLVRHLLKLGLSEHEETIEKIRLNLQEKNPALSAGLEKEILQLTNTHQPFAQNIIQRPRI